MRRATRLASLSAMLAALIPAVAGCSDQAVPTATATQAPARVMVEDLSCQDFYPGVPGPVPHRLQASGTMTNQDGPSLQNAHLLVIVTAPGGTLTYPLEIEGADPAFLDLPAGSSVSFNASKNMTYSDPSFEDGTCRVRLIESGHEIVVTGGEGTVRAFYAP